MKQHFKIIDYAISSLLRRKSKSIAILLAYTLTVATLGSVLFLTLSLRSETSQVLQSAPDLIVQRTVAGRQELVPMEYGSGIETIFGVRKVTPRYWGYYYDALTKANYTILGSSSTTPDLTMLEGTLPGNEFECAIGAGVSDIRGAGQAGEIILVDSKKIGVLFEVSGIFSADSSLLTNDLIVLTEKAVIDFFGFPTQMATDLAVTVPNKNEVQTIASKIQTMFPDSRPITKQELIRTYDMVFNWRSGMMLTVFSAAVIAFCIMAWDKATGISADEKREIGILKAIGWNTSDILVLKFWEGFIISSTAFLMGIIFSYLHIYFFDGFVIAKVIKGWSVLFPPFKLVPELDLFQLLTMGFLTVTPYIASTVVPTWKTAITDPDSVMRGN